MVEVNFRQTIAVLSETRDTKPSPLTGKIKSVMMHFPPGCASLVEVRVMKGAKLLVPITGYVALDNASPIFPQTEPIQVGDPIICEFINHDNTNPHTITVVVGVEEA